MRGGLRSGACIALIVCLGLGGLAGRCAAQDGGAGEPTIRQRILERLAQWQPPGPAPQPVASPPARLTKPGDYAFSLAHGAIERSYLVHIPPQYDPSVPMPLLVSLHGGGANMHYQARDANYGQISKSNSAGFIVVFPNGYSRLPGGRLATWNAGRCCGPARDRHIDDVGFIRQMIGDLEQQLNVDRKRIFATGMSNGGLMAERLACDMADTFKAVAAVAATDNTRHCDPDRPVSVLEIHALDDDHIPFNGGMGAKSLRAAATDFTSVPDSIARWVRRNACPAPPGRVLDRPGAYCDRYAPCRDGTRVELCVTQTGGHSWPGASRWRGSEPPSSAISANDVMWDFFLHP